MLVSAIGLAYYGYSFASEVSSRERAIISDTMRELGQEKVDGIESQILETDRKVFDSIALEPLPDLQAVVKTHGAAVASVFVLDERLQVVPGGYATTRSREDGLAFRDYFVSQIVPTLPLAAQPLRTRGHVHGGWGDRPFLFSFTRRAWGDRTYYVVLEADLSHLVGAVFPQFFGVRSPRLYQVVDESGDLVYGIPFSDRAGVLAVELPFVDTVDHWTLRVAQKDSGAQLARSRRQVIDFVLVGLSLAGILAGLGFLVLAIRRERRANALKSDFITNVSHELKTPLSIISMFGELLASGRTRGAAQATEYAEIIWRESVRLARLIDNVLDFAKIERGVDAYEFAEADLGEVVERALELSRHRQQQAGLTVHATIEAGLPPVSLDANAYTLAVLNLVDNAIKYAPDGERIEVALARRDDRLELTVRDFGPGIEAEEHGKIFERFYRARAVRLRPIRGSGIGLALVDHIARAHRGGVSVESEPGQGATFRLWIPAPPPGEADPAGEET
ncbi:MAG: HAMP domain-containing sensor histidine kinase [Kofleriaceae bacterium]